jgi:hypothetical protein
MDELNICNVRKRAILDMDKQEQASLEKRVDELGLKKSSDNSNE